MKFTSAEIAGEPPIPVRVARSPRMRNIKLSVSRADGVVTLSVPERANLAEALEFAAAKRSWVLKKLAGADSRIPIRYGIEFPLEGTHRTILPTASQSAHHDSSSIFVPGPESEAGANLMRYCIEMAKPELAERSHSYAALIDRSILKISIRDTKSRWGSCTQVPGAGGGRLNYSWRLIMAPIPVLDYVAAHEVAHLVELNHSSRFWSLVESICPDYGAHRAWLRKNGAKLQRYAF